MNHRDTEGHGEDQDWVFIRGQERAEGDVKHGPTEDLLAHSHVYGTFFVLIGGDTDWVLAYADCGLVCVSRRIIEPVAAPEFAYGHHVTTNPPRTRREGIVFRIQWHWKSQETRYQLLVDGRLHKSLYRPGELACSASL